ncbi:N-acyl amino acid synthase, PEP-CTERM/exosortase system-associated [Nitrosomonas aestuarii]|uniref:N-acyl amino acid synthase, PEP-CTERM/exosortase system-associated n=1 Tax=Nitrosomonas aestuarii TaxID=52441 RepID=A0A1I4H9G7_9PROT|nr:PEP-CTERM/exosortase system-associated acyltransferase [Nitrosomonas aestuarii]SFL38805.1 N-acyl amino acid synthase, PEP-CTERM/exosortase system-associated [Nitrosomonas aestuarii]
MNESVVQLGENFQKYFEMVHVKSDEQKNDAFRIRHQVYCEELKYESLHEDKRETDEYDSDSMHLLLRSKKSGEFIGCTRIICPRLNAPEYQLPIEKICAGSIDNTIIDLKKIPRNEMAEVSRLAVVANYRRRKSDSKSAISITNADFTTENEERRFPYIPVSLYLATIRLAQINGIEYLFVLTEERLAHHFGKLGFDIQLIGKSIEHRGKRVPSMVRISSSISRMYPSLRSLYLAIVKDIEKT